MKGLIDKLTSIQRWYDKIPRLREFFLVIKYMNDRETELISTILYQCVNDYRKNIKNQSQLISVGREKVLGYYKAYGKRRWYDQNKTLTNAIKHLSVMENKEIEEILNDFHLSLRNEGFTHLYENKKNELIKTAQNSIGQSS